MKPKYLLGLALIAAAVVFLIVTSMSGQRPVFLHRVDELRGSGPGTGRSECAHLRRGGQFLDEV